MVPFSFWRALQSNCERLKYVWNVYCITGIANHGQDLQPQKTKKHVEFPSVMEQICSISKGLKIDPLFQNIQLIIYNKILNRDWFSACLFVT